MLSRRSVLAVAAGLIAAPARAAPTPDLEILAAPTGASISLARVVDSGALNSVAPGARFQIWRDPDVLRAEVIAERALLFAAPTNLPANLANRGLPVKMLCQLGRGHLSLVTARSGVASLRDLVGKDVLGFFRNDMPDLVFRACAKIEGLDPDKDFKLSYVQNAMEAAQMLAGGKAETAFLPEPAATMAIMMAQHQGRALSRAIELQNIWLKRSGAARMPMLGLAIHRKLLESTPEILPALRAALPEAKDWALANREAAAALAEKTMQIRPHPFQMAIERFNMEIISARAAKADFEAFYKTILDLSPAALGGKPPPDDFYLDF